MRAGRLDIGDAGWRESGWRLESVAGWALGAVLAVGLHGLLALPFLTPVDADPDEEAGAAGIAIGIETAAPKAEPSDLPPGPDSDSAASSTASVRQRVETKPVEAPMEKPVESEEPDRIVAPEKPEVRTEPEPTPRTETSERSVESTRSEQTATPTVEKVKEAPVSTTPTQGSGVNASRIRATWQRELVARLDRNKRYPVGGARRDVEIVVGFTIDRSGRLQSAAIVRSSGEPAFDGAALDMMRRADPLPAPPALVADEGLTFRVPVVFRANRRG